METAAASNPDVSNMNFLLTRIIDPHARRSINFISEVRAFSRHSRPP